MIVTLYSSISHPRKSATSFALVFFILFLCLNILGCGPAIENRDDLARIAKQGRDDVVTSFVVTNVDTEEKWGLVADGIDVICEYRLPNGVGQLEQWLIAEPAKNARIKKTILAAFDRRGVKITNIEQIWDKYRVLIGSNQPDELAGLRLVIARVEKATLLRQFRSELLQDFGDDDVVTKSALLKELLAIIGVSPPKTFTDQFADAVDNASVLYDQARENATMLASIRKYRENGITRRSFVLPKPDRFSNDDAGRGLFDAVDRDAMREVVLAVPNEAVSTSGYGLFLSYWGKYGGDKQYLRNDGSTVYRSTFEVVIVPAPLKDVQDPNALESRLEWALQLKLSDMTPALSVVVSQM